MQTEAVADREKLTKKTSKNMHNPPLSSGHATEKSQPVATHRYALRSSSGKKTQKDVEDEPDKTSKKRANKDSGSKPVKKSKVVKIADMKTPPKSNKKSSTSKNGANASGSTLSAMKEYAEDQDTVLVIYKDPFTGKGKAKAEPTYEEMLNELLSYYNFNNIRDIRLPVIAEQLGQSFGQDLSHKMLELREVAREVVRIIFKKESLK